MTTPASATALDIASAPGSRAQMRVGTVVSFTANQAQVSVSGTTFTASYLSGTTLSVGAFVALLTQDGSWLILGTLAGVGGNLLTLNPSFEAGLPGVFPPDWQFANTTATSSAITATDADAPDGDQVASVAGSVAGAAVSILYSEPIAVNTGDQFRVSAFVGGDYDAGVAATASADLLGLWFANATNLYPTTSSADTVIASTANIVESPPFTTLSGTVTAPVNGFMRIGLRSNLTGTQRLKWDQIIVRRA